MSSLFGTPSCIGQNMHDFWWNRRLNVEMNVFARNMTFMKPELCNGFFDEIVWNNIPTKSDWRSNVTDIDVIAKSPNIKPNGNWPTLENFKIWMYNESISISPCEHFTYRTSWFWLWCMVQITEIIILFTTHNISIIVTG